MMDRRQFLQAAVAGTATAALPTLAIGAATPHPMALEELTLPTKWRLVRQDVIQPPAGFYGWSFFDTTANKVINEMAGGFLRNARKKQWTLIGFEHEVLEEMRKVEAKHRRKYSPHTDDELKKQLHRAIFDMTDETKETARTTEWKEDGSVVYNHYRTSNYALPLRWVASEPVSELLFSTSREVRKNAT